jgi:hypothetical protein
VTEGNEDGKEIVNEIDACVQGYEVDPVFKSLDEGCTHT